MKRKKLLMSFLLCLCIGMTYGQTKVRGTVVDDSNVPVVGASVTGKGLDSQKGTLTDAQGNFSLTVPADHTTLIISHVGMKTQEVKAKPKVDVVMNATNQTLGEVKINAEFGMKRLARSVGLDAQTVTGKEISESGMDN